METPPSELYLDLAGRPVTVHLRRRTGSRSAHTGRELTELHGWVTTTDPLVHAWLAQVLPEVEDRAVRARDAEGEFAGNWQVSWNAYGETAGVHTYTLILREAEELTLESLEVAGVELHPYEYREAVHDDGLVLWAKMVGTQDELDRLRTHLQDVPAVEVVRHGIHSAPRRMRLGAGEWSDYEDRVKFRLVLLDETLGPGAAAELTAVDEENGHAALAYYANLVERLAELLVESGVVDQAGMDAAREAARREPRVDRHEFWHVPDVDAL